MGIIGPLQGGGPIPLDNSESSEPTGLFLVTKDGTSSSTVEKPLSLLEFLKVPADAKHDFQLEIKEAQDEDIQLLRKFIERQFDILEAVENAETSIKNEVNYYNALVTVYNDAVGAYNTALSDYANNPVEPRYDAQSNQENLTTQEKAQIDQLIAAQNTFNSSIDDNSSSVSSQWIFLWGYLDVDPIPTLQTTLATQGTISEPTTDQEYKDFVNTYTPTYFSQELSNLQNDTLSFEDPDALAATYLEAVKLRLLEGFSSASDPREILEAYVNSDLDNALIKGQSLVLPSAFIQKQPDVFLSVGGAGSSAGSYSIISGNESDVREESSVDSGIYKTLTDIEEIPLTSKIQAQHQLLSVQLQRTAIFRGPIKTAGVLGNTLAELDPAGPIVGIVLAFSIADQARELVRENVLAGKLEQLVRDNLSQQGVEATDEQVALAVSQLSAAANIELLSTALKIIGKSLEDPTLAPKLLEASGILSASDIQAGIAGTSEVDKALADPLGVLFLKGNILNNLVTQYGFTTDAAGSVQNIFSEVLQRRHNTLDDLRESFLQSANKEFDTNISRALADDLRARVRADLGQKALDIGVDGQSLREIRNDNIQRSLDQGLSLQDALDKANGDTDAIRRDILGRDFQKRDIDKEAIDKEFSDRIEKAGGDGQEAVKQARQRVDQQSPSFTSEGYAADLRNELIRNNQDLKGALSQGVGQIQDKIPTQSLEELKNSIESEVLDKAEGNVADNKAELIANRLKESAVKTTDSLKSEINALGEGKQAAYEYLKSTISSSLEETNLLDNNLRPAKQAIGSLAGAMGRKRSISMLEGV